MPGEGAGGAVGAQPTIVVVPATPPRHLPHPPRPAPTPSQDGTLLTAPEGEVLGGTVRRLVLEVAAREGIPVALTPPLLGGAEGWSGCFLSSTSRLVLPVDELTVGGAEGEAPAVAGAGGDRRVLAVPSAGCPIVTRLEALVAAEVAAHSTRLIGDGDAPAAAVTA